MKNGDENGNHYQTTLMALTRIDKVLEAMVKPALAKARRSPLLVLLENGEELRSVEAVERVGG